MREIKYKLAKKAYIVHTSSVDEGFLADQDGWVSYAESKGKAKSELFNEIVYCGGFEKLRNGDEITFLNLPVVRCKERDKYEFNGKELTTYEIAAVIREQQRISELDVMLLNPSVNYCYIKKGGYYRPGGAGYTDMKHRAGVFTKEEGVRDAKSCRDLDIIPINIEEHNKMIQAEIDDLKTRLL